MATNPVGGATSTDQSGSTTTTAVAQSALGKDEFLKLLMAQLQNQDPMSPMDNTEFIAQMAQFSSVEQLTNLANAMTTLNSNQQRAAAVSEATSLIGHTVTVTPAASGSEEATPVTGVVTSVKLADGWPQIVIDGKTYDPSFVSEVA